jgi:hypothetical protein
MFAAVAVNLYLLDKKPLDVENDFSIKAATKNCS